jgi:hypothetical protein
MGGALLILAGSSGALRDAPVGLDGTPLPLVSGTRVCAFILPWLQAARRERLLGKGRSTARAAGHRQAAATMILLLAAPW